MAEGNSALSPTLALTPRESAIHHVLIICGECPVWQGGEGWAGSGVGVGGGREGFGAGVIRSP